MFFSKLWPLFRSRSLHAVSFAFLWSALCGLTTSDVALAIPAPTAASAQGTVVWPKQISGLCRKILNICHTSCTKRLLAKNKGGNRADVSASCRRLCWHNPLLRQRFCKMNAAQFLDAEQTLLDLESQEEQAEQRRIVKERRTAQLLLRYERMRRQRVEQALRRKLRRVAKGRSQLKQEKQELQRLRQEIRKQRSAQKTTTAERRRLAEERKRLKIQRQAYEEHQKRLVLERQLAEKRRKEEAKRAAEKKRQMAELERLRKERLREVASLKRSRQEQSKKLKALKKLAAERERIRREQALVEQQRRAAAASKKRRLEREKRRLAKKMARVRRREQRLAEQKERARKAREARRRRLARLRSRSKKRMAQKQPVHNAEPAGVGLFREGQYDAAQQTLLGEGHTDLAKKVGRFVTAYRRGLRAYKTRNTDGAIPALERALTLHLGISGGSGGRYRSLRRMLSVMYNAKGRLAFSSRYYGSAYAYFSSSLRYNPGSIVAVQQIGKIRDIAQGLYDQALRKKKSQPELSRRLLHKAIKMLPRSDALYTRISDELEG